MKPKKNIDPVCLAVYLINFTDRYFKDSPVGPWRW